MVHLQVLFKSFNMERLMEPCLRTEDTINLIRDINYLCTSLSAFNIWSKVLLLCPMIAFTL